MTTGTVIHTEETEFLVLAIDSPDESPRFVRRFFDEYMATDNVFDALEWPSSLLHRNDRKLLRQPGGTPDHRSRREAILREVQQLWPSARFVLLTRRIEFSTRELQPTARSGPAT